jgi:hypothetical protein
LRTYVVSSQNGTLVQEDYTQVSIAKLMNIRLIFTFVLVLEIFNSVWVMVRCTRYKIMGQMKVREYRRGNQLWVIKRNWQHMVHKTKKSKTQTLSRAISDKRLSKPKGQLRMDNPETLAALGTQCTRHKTKTDQTKHTKYVLDTTISKQTQIM